MAAVMEKRPTAAGELQAAEDQIRNIRGTVGELNRQLANCSLNINRCHDEAQRLVAVVNAPAAAKASLAQLHARRHQGEKVDDAAITRAAADLKKLEAFAKESEAERDGLLAAEAKWNAKHVELMGQLASVRRAALPAVGVILRKRLEDAREKHAAAFATFAKSHAQLHGLAAALAEFAAQIGIPTMSLGFSNVNQWAPRIEAGIPPRTDDDDISLAIETMPEVKQQAAKVLAELQALLP